MLWAACPGIEPASAPTERGHLGDVANAVPLGEKPNRLKVPSLHDIGARNISITQPFDAQM
jgi:hypothetical protein